MLDRKDDLGELLRRHDPARTDPPLQGEDLARMRRAVMTAAATRGAASTALPLKWAAALALLAAVAAVAVWPPPRPAGPAGPPIEASANRVLQVQMVTPGGTRIHWVLNPDLSL